MSGIGARAVALTVTRLSKAIVQDVTPYFRQTVNASIAGHAPTNAENLSLFFFYGSTLVMTPAAAFAGSPVALGAIESNTTALQTYMAGVATNGIRTLTARLYDGQTKEKLAEGNFDIMGIGTEYDADGGATPVSPIEGTTVIWGNLAKYAGRIYGLNDDDGYWYPVSFRGPGGTIHLELGEQGIVIPTP